MKLEETLQNRIEFPVANEIWQILYPRETDLLVKKLRGDILRHYTRALRRTKVAQTSLRFGLGQWSKLDEKNGDSRHQSSLLGGPKRPFSITNG